MTDTLTISAAKTSDAPLLKLVSTATGDGDAIIELEANDTGEAGIIFKNPDNTNTAGWFLGYGDAVSEQFYLYDYQNNATRLVVGHNGKVGIGTASPQSTLHIVDTSTKGLEFEEITGGVMRILAYDRANSTYETLRLNASDLQFNIGTSTAAVIDTNGNVGIGTTSPDGKLAVQQGSGEFTALLGADVTNGGLTNSTRKFTRIGMPHYTNAEQPFSLITGDSDGTNNILSIGGGTSAGNAATQIYLKTAANTTTIDGTTRLFIGSDGNVGIGTESPDEKLTLQHHTKIGWEYSSTDSNVYTTIGTPTTSEQPLEFKQSWTSGSGATDKKIYSFYGTPGGTSTELLTITNGGNVGIGTTTITSGYKLEVNGKVKASNGKLSTVKYTDASTSTTTEVDSVEFELDGSTLTITTT